MSGEYNNWMPPTDISFNEDLDRYKHNEECGLIAQDILESDVSFVVIQDIDKMRNLILMASITLPYLLMLFKQ